MLNVLNGVMHYSMHLHHTHTMPDLCLLMHGIDTGRNVNGHCHLCPHVLESSLVVWNHKVSKSDVSRMLDICYFHITLHEWQVGNISVSGLEITWKAFLPPALIQLNLFQSWYGEKIQRSFCSNLIKGCILWAEDVVKPNVTELSKGNGTWNRAM